MPIMTAGSNPLTSLVVDWRYQIPADLTDLTGPTHPVLYVAGKGGVFRSLDKGSNWVQFPPMSDGSTADGGYLPTVIVTDLDLVIGNIDPATGKPNMAAEVINPLTGLLEGLRWSLLGTAAPSTGAVVYSVAATVAASLIGLVVFSRLERQFADVI